MACMTACQNTPKTPALDMANFDLSVAPNADFYEYATGGWQKNNPLKPEYAPLLLAFCISFIKDLTVERKL